MSAVVLLCGNLLDGVSETLSGPMEILVEANRITSVATDSTNPFSLGLPRRDRVLFWTAATG